MVQQTLSNRRKACMNSNDYPVYPEQQGDEDRPLNPYSPV